MSFHAPRTRFAFAALCHDFGVAHPAVSAAPPSDPTGWLRKRIGGAGGAHVRLAKGKAAKSEDRERLYFQRQVTGRAVSLLFLADGKDTLPLGFSAQWSNPTREAPFRFGGAVRPAGIGPRLKRRLCADAENLARHLGLRGLNSADFLIEGDTAWLIEINPRPGATLDLFDSPSAPLFALHVDACRGVSAGARAPMAGGRRGRDRLRHAPDSRDASARLARNGAPTGKAPDRASKPARRSAPFRRKRVPPAAPGRWSKSASSPFSPWRKGVRR